MDLSAWTLYAFIAAGVIAATLLHYQRREPAGRGRLILAGLRAGTLALLLLLLFNPVVPAMGRAAEPLTMALVDGSLSMRLQSPDGTSRWDEARRAVAELRPDRVLVFGGAEAVPVTSLGDVEPRAPSSRLAPTLRAALEGGARRVVVVTDGALEDAHEVERLALERDLRLEVVRVGERTAGNVGLAELEVPGWARAGEQVEVGVGVARLGEVVPESVTVTLRWGAQPLARSRVATPPEGRVSTAVLRFTPRSEMQGRVRLDAGLDVDDAEPADDQRSAYLAVAERPAGVALVSFSADQEPRFLLPVLERSLGVPARGWLAVGPGRFVRVGVGREAGTVATEAEVRRALADADLVVLHGLDDRSPAWARAAIGGPRVLLFARGPLAELPVRLREVLPGEWYASPEVPASPLAPFLSAVQVEGAPPLRWVRLAEAPQRWWSPLQARQERRGEARPVLLAGEVGARRMVVAVADGYWRWAFGGGDSRALYDALWSGAASWVMAAAPAAVAEGARPEARVAPRGVPVRWLVPPETDSLRVSLRGVPGPAGGVTDLNGGPVESAELALDTVLVALDGVAVQAPPPPGHYRYDARAYGLAGEVATGDGEVTVERYSPEFTRASRGLRPAVAGGEEDAPAEALPGRSLRASGWPYVALVALLCGEWVLRRRWGLR